MASLRRSIYQTMMDWFENPTFVRLLFVGVVLLFSFALPLAGSLRLVQFGLLMVVGLVGVWFFWRWPAISLVLTIVGGMLIPFSGPAGINIAVLGIALLMAVWIVDMILLKKQITLNSIPILRPLFALGFVTILSFLVGQLPWFPFASPAPMQAQIGGLLIFIFCIGAFLVVAHQITKLEWLKWLSWTMVVLGAIHISGWIVPGAGRFVGRLFVDGTTNNAMFWIWLTAISFSQALINRKLHIGWRLALGIVAAATLYVAFFMNSGWKSGYLPAIVAVAAILGFRYPRAGIVLAVVGIIPAQILFSQAIATDVYSFLTRFDALVIMLELSKENPLLGFGPANYYWYVPLYRIRGYVSVFSSHNQYLDLLAQTGILGVLSTFWFAWEAGRLGWRLRKRVPTGFAEAYVYGALGGLVASMASGVLADWLIPFVYNIGFTGFRGSMMAWIFLGGLVTLDRLYASDKTEGAKAAIDPPQQPAQNNPNTKTHF